MKRPAEFRQWTRPDIVDKVRAGDVVRQRADDSTPTCRPDDSLSEVARILARFPHCRTAFVVDDEGGLRGQVPLSSLSRVLLFDYQPIRLLGRSLIPAITADRADDVMEPVDPVVPESDRLDQVLNKLVRAGAEECAIVDRTGSLIGHLTVTDILNEVVCDDPA